MSRIDDLIRELCPNGVEFRALGDVAQYSKERVSAELLDETSFVGVDNLLSNKRGKVSASYRPNTAMLTAYQPGDVLLGNIRPYLKKVWLADTKGGCSGDVLAIHLEKAFEDRILPRFLFYILSSDGFFAYDSQHAKGAKMPRGSKDAILLYRIPVPPMEVQREIVRVLDLFQSLEAELEVELEARRRQYAHYRDSLLAFDERSVQWVPMGEFGAFTRGKRFTKADYDPDGVDCIHYGEIYTEFGTSTTSVISHVRRALAPKLRYAQPGDVVLTDVGETVDDVGKAVAWLGDGEVAIHDHCYAFRHSLDPTYVSYCMQTASFRAQKNKHVARTKVKTLLMGGFATIAIPVPDRMEQERIVSILDSFDALVNDLSVGLPAELVARRKQYEYYRDRLLSFDEAA